MKRLVGAIAIAAAAAAAITIGCVGAANAAPQEKTSGLGVTDSGLVKPAVTNASGSFYSEAQIDDVWHQVTAHFPAQLPAGVSFPAAAPAFFHPHNTSPSYFQTGLPDNFAAQYWRCAWLNTSVGASKTNDLTGRQNADKQLTKFASLPSVAADFDLPNYAKMVSGFATAHKLDQRQAEIDLQCSGVYPGGK